MLFALKNFFSFNKFLLLLLSFKKVSKKRKKQYLKKRKKQSLKTQVLNLIVLEEILKKLIFISLKSPIFFCSYKKSYFIFHNLPKKIAFKIRIVCLLNFLKNSLKLFFYFIFKKRNSKKFTFLF